MPTTPTRYRSWSVWWLLLTLLPITLHAAGHDYQRQQERLMEELRRLSAIRPQLQLSDQTLQALSQVPRHQFVPANQRRNAYENRPLPIGHGQTISQPYIVALMTELLKPTPGARILEVGTGSGYQAAVLAQLVEHVYSIEIVPPWPRASKDA